MWLSLEFVDEIPRFRPSHAQMKTRDKCIPVLLFISLYKVVLAFDTVDKILSVGIHPQMLHD